MHHSTEVIQLPRLLSSLGIILPSAEIFILEYYFFSRSCIDCSPYGPYLIGHVYIPQTFEWQSNSATDENACY